MSHRRRPSDPISEVLRDLRLSRSSCLRSELTSPWGMRLPGCDGALYHFVAEGSCVLRCGGRVETMTQGDFVLLPRGPEHDLLETPDSPVAMAATLPNEEISALGLMIRHGGGGALSTIVSGSLQFERHPIIGELPEVIFVRSAGAGGRSWVGRTVKTLCAEVADPGPGSETVINRLSDVLVIGAIRSWLDAGVGAREGWVGALHQDGLGRVLALMYTEAERPWTLKALAAEAHMSRASFAQKFKQHVGTPPMHYLAHRRMELASRWLREDQLTLAAVSTRLGYSSEAAFSRAFKRHTGATPGSVARASSA